MSMILILVSFCPQNIKLFFSRLKSYCVGWLVLTTFPSKTRIYLCPVQCLVHSSARFPVNPFPSAKGKFKNYVKLQNGTRFHTFQIRLQLCPAYFSELIYYPIVPLIRGWGGVWLEIGVWSLGQQAGWNLSGGPGGSVVLSGIVVLRACVK